MPLHVSVISPAHVFVVSVVEHVRPQAHRIHILVHEILSNPTHHISLLLLSYFHEMLRCLSKDFI